MHNCTTTHSPHIITDIPRPYISSRPTDLHRHMFATKYCAAARHRFVCSVFFASLCCTGVVCQPFPAVIGASEGVERHAVCSAVALASEPDPTTVGAATRIPWSHSRLDNGGYICLAQAPHFSPVPALGIVTTWTSLLYGTDYINQTLCNTNCPIRSASSFSSFFTTNVTMTPQNQNQYTVRWACYDKTSYAARVLSCSEMEFSEAFASFFANMLNNGLPGSQFSAASSAFGSDALQSRRWMATLCFLMTVVCSTWRA